MHDTCRTSLVLTCGTRNCSPRLLPTEDLIREYGEGPGRPPRLSPADSSMQWSCNALQAWRSILTMFPQSRTDPACTTPPPYAVMSPEDKIVAGLTAQQPGKLWNYITGHLKVLKTTTNKSYFDEITYVKVPAFWSHLMQPVQFHHGLVSVSDKEVSADGCSRCKDSISMPPELLKNFDHSVLSTRKKRFQMEMPHALHSRTTCIAYCR